MASFALAPKIGIGRGRIAAQRRHVDDPLDAGAPRLGDDVRDAGHVDVREPLLALGRDRDCVDHRVEAVERAAQGLWFAHVASAHVNLRAGAGKLPLGTGTLADDRPHVVALEEQPGDGVPPDETVRAGYRDPHGLTALILRRCSSSTRNSRVKAPARGQDRQHDPAGQRVDEAEELRLLQPVDEERVQPKE